MPRILVIDDMAIFRDVVSAGLGHAGYETDTATNGREALTKCKATRPDLVMLDIAMPVMDGLKFLEALRSDDELADVPVILLSALANRQTIARAARLGIKDYLLKSGFSLADLLDRVARHIGPANPENGPSATAAAAKAPDESASSPPPTTKTPVVSAPPSFSDWNDIPCLLTQDRCLARAERALKAMAMPGVVAEVLAQVNSPRTELSDLTSLIGRDAALCARVLQTANSAAFSGGRKMVATLAEAVRKIGVGNVRNIAMALGVFEAIPVQAGDDFNPIRSWQHSFATAMLCEQLAAASELVDSGTAYLIGLCHELGQILFRTAFGPEYIQVMQVHAQTGHPLHQIMRHMLGTTHAELATVILKRMKLPDSIRHPIEEFHSSEPEPIRQAAVPQARMLRLADLYANGMLMAAAVTSEVAPITAAECQSLLGLDNPRSPDVPTLRNQILAMTGMLAKLPAGDEAKFAEPILAPTGRRVCLIREPSLSTFDPLATALESLAELKILPALPTPEQCGDFDVIIITARQPAPLPFAPTIPVLRVTLEPTTAEQTPGITDYGPTISLEKLSSFISQQQAAPAIAA